MDVKQERTCDIVVVGGGNAGLVSAIEVKNRGVDVLVLGCTHYPLLRPVIQDVMGESVTLVDSARETAAGVKAVLESEGLVGSGGGRPKLTCFLSDVPRKFTSIGRRFLGRPIDRVERVDQTDLPWYER